VILKFNISDFNQILIDKIIEIEKQSEYSHWTKQMFLDESRNKFSVFKIIEKDNKIIGFIIYRIVFDEAEILDVVIDKNFRGLKAGKYILNFAIEDIKKKKCSIIFLEVHQNNIVAQNLYKKAGFKQYSIREKYYNCFDALLMKLNL
jgi:ribosomal-protein-alanine N-acetyltransferase